jgi:hypothetical protein
MDKILSQNLQAVADQGCHLEGSSPYEGPGYRGVYCIFLIDAALSFREALLRVSGLSPEVNYLS